MSEDIFENNDEQKEIQQETPATPQEDLFKDQLSQIKNEHGEPKYKDVNAALKALQASQDFIEQLKREKQLEVEEKEQLRQEVEKMGSIEDFVNRVSPTPQPQKETETKVTSEGLTEEKVTSLLERKLSEQKDKEAKQANLSRVQEELLNRFGSRENAAEAIVEKAKELGVDSNYLREMATGQPQVFLSLFGQKSSNPSQRTPSTRTSTPAQQEDDLPERTSAARGGLTNKELAELFRRSKEKTNKRLGIEG